MQGDIVRSEVYIFDLNYYYDQHKLLHRISIIKLFKTVMDLRCFLLFIRISQFCKNPNGNFLNLFSDK